MTNENEEIKEGDMVSFDKMSGKLVKFTNESTQDIVGIAMKTYADRLAVQIDQQMKIFGEALFTVKLCIICKRPSHNVNPHLEYRSPKYDHPFITDNLQLLEWECTKRGK